MKKEVKIKSFEDACKLLKRNPKSLPVVSKLPKDEGEYITATYKLSVIAKALNLDQQTGEEWKPNWTDWNQYKHYPWFEVVKKKGSGSGFAFDLTDDWDTATCAGSRLCFKNRETAAYAGQKFIKLYEKAFMFPK